MNTETKTRIMRTYREFLGDKYYEKTQDEINQIVWEILHFPEVEMTINKIIFIQIILEINNVNLEKYYNLIKNDNGEVLKIIREYQTFIDNE